MTDFRPCRYNELIDEALCRLKEAYEFDNLGNKSDPVDELVYIVLSSRTRGPIFEATYSMLKSKYPTWEQVVRARRSSLEAILGPSGLASKKAKWLKQSLAEICKREGCVSLENLRDLSDEQIEQYLISLPGVGLKTARCVMMYSLDREVFPVDANSRRLLERLGVIQPGIHYYHVHDAVQEVIPPKSRRELHIYAVIHGRETCLPQNPRCAECPLLELCQFGHDPIQVPSDLM